TRYRDELQGFVRRKCRRQSPRSLRRFQSGAGALPERRVSLDDEPIKRAPTRKRAREAARRQSAAMQPGEKTPELRCIETLERRATGKRAQRRNVAQVRRARARRSRREGFRVRRDQSIVAARRPWIFAFAPVRHRVGKLIAAAESARLRRSRARTGAS